MRWNSTVLHIGGAVAAGASNQRVHDGAIAPTTTSPHFRITSRMRGTLSHRGFDVELQPSQAGTPFRFSRTALTAGRRRSPCKRRSHITTALADGEVSPWVGTCIY